MKNAIAIAAMVLTGAALAALGYFSYPGVPPKVDSRIPAELRTRYDQIRVDMTGAEVDEIMAGYQSSPLEESREDNGADSQRFLRPSVRTQIFGDRPHWEEGDFYLMVYFDAAGKVVGKRLGEWCK